MEIFINIKRMATCRFIIPFVILLHASDGLPTFQSQHSPELQSQNIHSENTPIYYMHIENLSHKEFEQSIHNKPVSHDNKKFSVLANYTTNINKVTCLICKGIVTLIQKLLGEAKTKAEIAKEVTKYCISLEVEDAKVCKGIVLMFQEEILTVFDKVAISTDTICGRIFGNSCGHSTNSSWNVTFPDTPKPPTIEPKLPKPGSPKLKILQIADLHIDFDYQPKAEVDCGEPLCCRKDNGPAKNGTGAGYWGDYGGCDLPTWTVENAFQHIAETHKDIDLIYWTGDLPGHNVWNQSRSDQLSYLKYLTKKLVQYFPKITVLPSVGNHESSPVNSFPPPFIKGEDSIKWLYEPMALYWSLWLPRETMATVKKGGYYSVLVRPGLRVVSLNMNYCNNQNWWLLLNSTDPAGQLQWLISILQTSEDAEEKVHILGHIPPGLPDCTPVWSDNFYKVVNRYESTISGMFFGHTHTDLFEIFYDESTNKRPIQVAYISPSLTAFGSLNPGYRIYTVDGSYRDTSFYVLDHETYIFNLSLANEVGHPQWFKEYSAKDAYNMTSLFPRDWNAITDRFQTNRTLFDIFYNYMSKLMKDPSACDDYCFQTTLCNLRTANSANIQCVATAEIDSKSDAYWKYYLQNKYC